MNGGDEQWILGALTSITGVPHDDLIEAVQRVRAGRGYRSFTTSDPVKPRTIHVPKPRLAAVQRQLLTRVLYAGPVSPAAFAGVPGRTVFDAARVHLRPGRTLVAVDVADAYPHTTRSKVLRALRRRLDPELSTLGLSGAERKEASGWIADLLTVELPARRTRCLPLGAPTSVATFNQVFLEIDRAIFRLLDTLQEGAEVSYTRYVDDLVVSSAGPLHPDLEAQLAEVLGRFRYRLRSDKTRRLETDALELYGLTHGADGLELTDAQQRRCASKIHRALNAARGRGPASVRKKRIQELRGLESFLRQVYGPAPAARPAELRFRVPQDPPPAASTGVDVLWR